MGGITKNLREKYFLELEEIPQKADTFSEALREILGVSSVIIEDLIIENLYLKMGLEVKWKKNCKFSDYINEIKTFLHKNISTEVR